MTEKCQGLHANSLEPSVTVIRVRVAAAHPKLLNDNLQSSGRPGPVHTRHKQFTVQATKIFRSRKNVNKLRTGIGSSDLVYVGPSHKNTTGLHGIFHGFWPKEMSDMASNTKRALHTISKTGIPCRLAAHGHGAPSSRALGWAMRQWPTMPVWRRWWSNRLHM
jgi:hypothetical protein